MASKNIPMEITIEILAQLYIKTLSRFKCVCKTWKNLIESPEFFKLHLKKSLNINSYNCSLILTIYRNLTSNNSPIAIRTLYRAYLDLNDTKLKINKLTLPKSFETNPESIRRYQKIYRNKTENLVFGKTRIVGSCNGLILIWGGKHHIAICNPSIEQNASFKILPILNYRGVESHYRSYSLNFENQRYPRYVGRSFDFRVFGFGYDSYSNCYKIVSFSAKRAFIYSLMKESHSWREINLPDFDQIFHSEGEEELYIKPYNHGTPTNNHLHWNITKYDPYDFDFSKEMILSFDLKNEEWGEVQVPAELNRGYFLKGYIAKPYIIELGVLNGCLCLLISRGISSPKLELWMMKEYGVKESWTKVCNLPIGSGIPLVYRVERNEYLLTGIEQGLGWYNPQEKRIRKMEFHGCEFNGEYYYSTRVTMCIESFVDPLKSIDEVGVEENGQQ